MCWGAVQWSRLNKVYIGADRFTAAKYGFDDKVFYDEVEQHSEKIFGLHRYGYMVDSHAKSSDGAPAQKVSEERVHKHMMEVHTGILQNEVERLFTGATNKTYRRRLNSGQGMLRKVYEDAFGGRPKSHEPERTPSGETKPDLPAISSGGDVVDPSSHEAFMRRAVDVARLSSKHGASKEREPFGAVVVREGQVIATGTNSVLQSRDATATAEVNAIRAAAKCMGTYNLQECTMYCTTVPDVMSMSACLWARVPRVFCGVTQEFALRFGHEEGWLHFKELATEDAGKRTIQSQTNVARSACEDVFKFWASLAGKIY
jgi:tRNA(Arg) A34 adenosine deaminase TadA